MGYPVGGTGQDVFIMIEMHYDNPGRDEGMSIMSCATNWKVFITVHD